MTLSIEVLFFCSAFASAVTGIATILIEMQTRLRMNDLHRRIQRLECRVDRVEDFSSATRRDTGL
jgi:7,8-dihydro-6-hydroxymethylpterin-pyrophosphokinase